MQNLTSMMSTFIAQSQLNQYNMSHLGNPNGAKVVVEPKSSSRKRSLAFSGDGDGKCIKAYTLNTFCSSRTLLNSIYLLFSVV